MNEEKSGYILINKPSGPTSHDIIDSLRKITAIKKIGHAGTLDPFASGLLIVAIGREATRGISKFVKLDKEYAATLHLGATTDTYDREGVRNQELGIRPAHAKASADKKLELGEIEKVLEKFIGKQKQVPPMYSAKKVKGKKLYELARKGVEIKREPVDIEIKKLEIIDYEWPILKSKCRVSSGTYIRSLAHDIGEALGCGAYLEELVRTAIGEYLVKQSKEIEELKNGEWENFLI